MGIHTLCFFHLGLANVISYVVFAIVSGSMFTMGLQTVRVTNDTASCTVHLRC